MGGRQRVAAQGRVFLRGIAPKVPAVDLFEQLDRSIVAFGTRLRVVGAEHWSLATPCDEWDVRALVNHVVGGATRYTMMLHGASADEVVATVAVDHLGEDPVTSFEQRAQEVGHAFREPGALLRTVHHPAGDLSGQELLELRITEFAVHGWDLARAIGGDKQIDPALVDEMWKRMSGAGAGPDDGESPLERLLHLTGRRR
jgi:uncharacterized protein (TIGR03086 family)